MRRTVRHAELHVAGSCVGAHVERERHRQQVLVVVPVDVQVDVELTRLGTQLVGGHDSRWPEAASDVHATEQRTVGLDVTTPPPTGRDCSRVHDSRSQASYSTG